MTAAPESPESALAAVLAEHWSYEPTGDFEGWLCDCGARIMDREGDTDTAMQAHLAAILAATPTAARIEADGVTFIRALVGAWDCCGTCAGGVLARHDADSATRIAQLEADLAAARSALGAVEAVVGKYGRPAASSSAQHCRAVVDSLRADIRAALATPPDGGEHT